MRAPFGDEPCDDDIGNHRKSRCRNQPPAEIAVEDDLDPDQLHHRWYDVEQQEIEHGIDALGAAFDDFGHLAGAPGKVKAQGQPMQAGKDVFGQPPRCILPDAFKHDVAQIIEDHTAKAPGRISQHPAQRQNIGGVALNMHAIDRVLQKEGQRHADLHRGGNQRAGQHNPHSEPRIIARPQVRDKTAHRVPAVVAGAGGVGVGVWGHRRLCRRTRPKGKGVSLGASHIAQGRRPKLCPR